MRQMVKTLVLIACLSIAVNSVAFAQVGSVVANGQKATILIFKLHCRTYKALCSLHVADVSSF